jgi:hypothetical protein
MDAKLKIQKYLGQEDAFVAFVKVEGVCDWTQVRLQQVDYYNRPTGSISVFYSQNDARDAARKFAQKQINAMARA